MNAPVLLQGAQPDQAMANDNWVRSLGLDTDGTLFVDMDNGVRLYDLCTSADWPTPATVHPADLMKSANRRLYYQFLMTLKEIDGIMYQSLYDGSHPFRKGDIVVDAGARIGTFTAKVSAAVGKEGKVIAIEPEPRNFACLQKNIEANRLSNVAAIPKMLWSRTARLPLYLSANAAAHSAWFDAFYSPTGESIGAEAEPLDDILAELGIKSVNFVKMDVEGSELEALDGMSGILGSDVQLSIAAYHPVNGKFTHSAVIPKLEQLGFKTTCSEGFVQAHR
jgi:FkbM family methyltransferase